MLGIFLPRIESIERDALIGADTRGFVDGVGIDAVIIHVALCARDEERAGLMKRV